MVDTFTIAELDVLASSTLKRRVIPLRFVLNTCAIEVELMPSFRLTEGLSVSVCVSEVQSSVHCVETGQAKVVVRSWRTDSRNRVDCSRRRIPIAAVAGDGWYHEDLNLTLVSDCMYFLIELSVVRGEHDVESIIYSLAHVAMLYWRIQGSDVVQDFVELVFTGSQPPPPHQLAEVQRQRASVRAAAKSVRVLCLGPHRLDVGASGWLHEVQRVVDAQVLELMFNEAPVRPPPVCYDGSPRAHMTLYDGEEGGG
ncbi:hypothetical protein M514_09007 [Trichuris suis]|uniref:Uncharacterized protein n=1 Tax=Trichuris suis TaxID=68888 RepID=A0A085MZ71_9BILA|nr:hypothetical protein M513_09007 [Trichuris suis]KFD62517.1 hypothetical protein M514_09007 [Trichuris suis]